MPNTELNADDMFDLVDLINAEMSRVFKDGFTGDSREYVFLQQHGIPEEDDVRFQIIGEYQLALSNGDGDQYLEYEDEEAMAHKVESLSGFLLDEDQVVVFLRTLLAQYKSISSKYVPD